MTSEIITRRATILLIATLNPSGGFSFSPKVPWKRPFTKGRQRSNEILPQQLLVANLAICHRSPDRATFGLFAQTNDNSNINNEPIYYDDFAEAVGDSFLGSPSSSQVELPLPDFDEPASSSSTPSAQPATSNDNSYDLTGSNVRQFSLGSSLLISDYVGSLGYDQVTDWQYYLQSVDDEGNIDPYEEKIQIQAPFMDPSKPSRTRSKSGSVVRIFRGEFTGKLGGMLRSNGMDNRVLMKEYSVDSLDLVEREKKGIAMMMSNWMKYVSKNDSQDELFSRLQAGDWIEAAQSRYIDAITDTPTKADDEHLLTLMTYLTRQKAPFTALLGQMNLNNYYDDENLDPNEWYRSLGVKPPSPGSVWLVYDYHGLSTANSYCQPLIFQQSKLPPKRGIFGNVMPPPPLPPFKERARYMVQGILKQMLTAVATTHDAGLLHKSLGRNSFILSSVGQDKREATSPYAVVVDRLRVVLSDWGFSQRIQDSLKDEEFVQRAQSFGIDIGYDVETAMEFAKAEDLHALGFVFLALLFTTLAEPATLSAPMPPTDDDTWQRLFSTLFEKDIDEFREYCTNEDVWDSVVELLDMEDGAGWSLLGDLLLAREKVLLMSNSETNNAHELMSARGLLSSPFFKMRMI